MRTLRNRVFILHLLKIVQEEAFPSAKKRSQTAPWLTSPLSLTYLLHPLINMDLQLCLIPVHSFTKFQTQQFTLPAIYMRSATAGPSHDNSTLSGSFVPHQPTTRRNQWLKIKSTDSLQRAQHDHFLSDSPLMLLLRIQLF